VQYSTTGDILDHIFSINLCNCLYRTAYAIETDALTNIFLNLVQLRITREASSRNYLILLLYFFFTCSRFLISKHVLQQVYEIPGCFHHTFFFKFENPEKLKIRKFVLRETREERLIQHAYDASKPYQSLEIYMPSTIVALYFVSHDATKCL
jgi:hypothetical protein